MRKIQLSSILSRLGLGLVSIETRYIANWRSEMLLAYVVSD